MSYVMLPHLLHCCSLQGKSLKGRNKVSGEGSSVGEAMLLPCNCPGGTSSRPGSTTTSSAFDARSSGYDNSFDSVAGCYQRDCPMCIIQRFSTFSDSRTT